MTALKNRKTSTIARICALLVVAAVVFVMPTVLYAATPFDTLTNALGCAPRPTRMLIE